MIDLTGLPLMLFGSGPQAQTHSNPLRCILARSRGQSHAPDCSSTLVEPRRLGEVAYWYWLCHFIQWLRPPISADASVSPRRAGIAMCDTHRRTDSAQVEQPGTMPIAVANCSFLRAGCSQNPCMGWCKMNSNVNLVSASNGVADPRSRVLRAMQGCASGRTRLPIPAPTGSRS